MKRIQSFLVSLPLVFLCFFACKKDSNSNPVTGLYGEVSAKVDGNKIVLPALPVSALNLGYGHLWVYGFEFQPNSGMRYITLGILNPDSTANLVGTYTASDSTECSFSSGLCAYFGYGTFIEDDTEDNDYNYVPVGNDFSLTISEYTNQPGGRIRGTFEGKIQREGDASDVIEVTDGEFDVDIP